MSEKLAAAQTPDDILACDDIETRLIDVPEWKCSVYLRALRADEGLDLQEALEAVPKEKRHRTIATMVASYLAAPDGSRLFKTPEDIAKLNTRSQKVLMRLQDEIMDMQGFEKNADGAWKEKPGKNALSEAVPAASPIA